MGNSIGRGRISVFFPNNDKISNSLRGFHMLGERKFISDVSKKSIKKKASTVKINTALSSGKNVAFQETPKVMSNFGKDNDNNIFINDLALNDPMSPPQNSQDSVKDKFKSP